MGDTLSNDLEEASCQQHVLSKGPGTVETYGLLCGPDSGELGGDIGSKLCAPAMSPFDAAVCSDLRVLCSLSSVKDEAGRMKAWDCDFLLDKTIAVGFEMRRIVIRRVSDNCALLSRTSRHGLAI